MNFSSADVKGPAASIFERCAAFSSKYCAPGTFSAMNRPSAGVVATSLRTGNYQCGRVDARNCCAQILVTQRGAGGDVAFGWRVQQHLSRGFDCAGARLAKSSVNQRGTTPLATRRDAAFFDGGDASVPAIYVPMRAAVLHSVRLLKRFDALMPNHWPINPPTEIPQ